MQSQFAELNMASKKKMTMGLIVGNRGFFPDHLAKTGREEMLQTLQNAGFAVVALTPEQSKYGAVETTKKPNAAPNYSVPKTPQSTASSSLFPILATSALSRIRCASRASMFPC